MNSRALSPPAVDFVLGGARSGKTGVALARAETSGRRSWWRPLCPSTPRWRRASPPIAPNEGRIGARRGTARSCRLGSRRRRRPSESVADCLTVWLGNVMFAERDAEAEIARLVATPGRLGGRSSSCPTRSGLGIVPENALTRRFRDLQGRLNRLVAAAADRVTLVVAGIEVAVKLPPGLAIKPIGVDLEWGRPNIFFPPAVLLHSCRNGLAIREFPSCTPTGRRSREGRRWTRRVRTRPVGTWGRQPPRTRRPTAATVISECVVSPTDGARPAASGSRTRWCWTPKPGCRGFVGRGVDIRSHFRKTEPAPH